MGLFSKKLTDEQKKVVEESIQQLRYVCIPSVSAWEKFIFDMYYPMTRCILAIQQGSNIEEIEPKTRELIKSALKSARKYQKILVDTLENSKRIEHENWYPKDYKKERESWKIFLEGQLGSIRYVIDALSKPDALKPLPSGGGGKLNVFVDMVNTMSMARHWDVVNQNRTYEYSIGQPVGNDPIGE